MIKSIRNFLNSSSKSVVSTLISLTLAYQPITQAGLVTASHWVYGTKHIYLLGDHHEAGTYDANNQQVDGFLEALDETSYLRNEPLHILWEKFSLSVKSINQLRSSRAEQPEYKNVMINLDDEFTQKNTQNVTLEDTEIRTIGISAGNVLSMAITNEFVGSFSEFEGAPLLKDLTFQHIIDSFNTWLRIVQEFRKQNESTIKAFNNFDVIVDSAISQYEDFMERLSKNNIDHSTNIVQFTKDSFARRDGISRQIERHNTAMFIHLYNVYLFKKLYEYKGAQIAVLAGALHTSHIEDILRDQHAKRLIECLSDESVRPCENIKILTKSELINVLKGYSYLTLIQGSLESIALQFIRLFQLMRFYTATSKPTSIQNS